MVKVGLLEEIGLRSMAVRISQKKDVNLYFRTGGSATNGNIIVLSEDSKENVNWAEGLMSHEAGHIGYGSFGDVITMLQDYIEKKYNLPAAITQKLLNVVEDVRIDLINSRVFPGFYRGMNNYLEEKAGESVKRNIEGDGMISLLLRLNLYLEGYHPEYKKFPDTKKYKLNRKEVDSILLAKKLLHTNSSPIASVFSAELLAPIFAKRFKSDEHLKTLDDYMPSDSNSISDIDDEELEDLIEELIDKIKDMDPEEIKELAEDMASGNYDDEEEPSEGEDNNEKSEGIEGNEEEDSEESNGKGDSSNPEEGEEDGEEDEEEPSEGEDDNREQSGEQSGEVNEVEDDIELNDEGEGNEEANIDNEDNEEGKNDNKDEGEGKGSSSSSEIPDLEDISDEESEEDSKANVAIAGNSVDLSGEHEIPEDLEIIFDRAKEIVKEKIESAKLGKTEQDENNIKREIFEENIDKNWMYRDPHEEDYNASNIRKKYNMPIKKLKEYLRKLKIEAKTQKYQREGRINTHLVRGAVSDFKYDRIFSKKVPASAKKVCIMVDVSGSMNYGDKMKAAKTALVVFSEAFKDICDLRIILFAGNRNAVCVVIKDYGKPLRDENLDLFGFRSGYGSNLDGISLKHEVEKMNDRQGIVLVISDGQPAGSCYGLNDAIPEFSDTRKKIKALFGFSIDAYGTYLDALYGKNHYVNCDSSNINELMVKLTKAGRLIIS